jgi:hypothetical protein
MKVLPFGLLLAMAASIGCGSLPNLQEEKAAPAPAPVVARPARPVNPVTADQVSENNAQKKIEELMDELDRDSAGEAGKP